MARRDVPLSSPCFNQREQQRRKQQEERGSGGQRSRGRHHPLLCLITVGRRELGGNGPDGRSVAAVQSPAMEILNI